LIDHPGDWQGGATAIVHPCTRYWLRFDFPGSNPLTGLTRSTTLSLKQAYAEMKRRHFPGSEAIHTLFRNLLVQQREQDAYAEDFARTLFHQILIEVVRQYERNQQKQVSPAIGKALDFLSTNLSTDIHVADISAAVGLSTGHFHDVFLRETGFTPARYHQRLRIAAAKQLLIVNDHSITDVAIELGYSSSQYFATTFRKLVGLTPQQYRRLRAG
jgi:transcriptional regulator GlxA family with amidase domain